MKYKCIKPLAIDIYNDQHIWLNEKITVKTGTVWEVNKELSYRYTSNNETLHLEKITEPTEGEWIELDRQTLLEHFEII